MTRASVNAIWLVALWVLLWGDLSAANVASGVVVALTVLGAAGASRVARAEDDDAIRIRPLATLWFGVFVLVKLVESNLVLAWEIVTPRNRINTGVVGVPLRTDSDIAMTIVSNVITLTPGTLTLAAHGSPPTLYVNVLHLHDIERVRRDLLRVEELSVRAFGSRAARAQLAARADDAAPSEGSAR